VRAVHRAGGASWLAVALAAALGLLYVTVLVWRMVRWVRNQDADDGGDSGGEGDGGVRRPPPRGPEPGPDWWPEFEREFAAYVDLIRSG
jgi:hypothetical protein